MKKKSTTCPLCILIFVAFALIAVVVVVGRSLQKGTNESAIVPGSKQVTEIFKQGSNSRRHPSPSKRSTLNFALDADYWPEKIELDAIDSIRSILEFSNLAEEKYQEDVLKAFQEDQTRQLKNLEGLCAQTLEQEFKLRISGESSIHNDSILLGFAIHQRLEQADFPRLKDEVESLSKSPNLRGLSGENVARAVYFGSENVDNSEPIQEAIRRWQDRLCQEEKTYFRCLSVFYDQNKDESNPERAWRELQSILEHHYVNDQTNKKSLWWKLVIRIDRLIGRNGDEQNDLGFSTKPINNLVKNFKTRNNAKELFRSDSAQLTSVCLERIVDVWAAGEIVKDLRYQAIFEAIKSNDLGKLYHELANHENRLATTSERSRIDHNDLAVAFSKKKRLIDSAIRVLQSGLDKFDNRDGLGKQNNKSITIKRWEEWGQKVDLLKSYLGKDVAFQNQANSNDDRADSNVVFKIRILRPKSDEALRSTFQLLKSNNALVRGRLYRVDSASSSSSSETPRKDDLHSLPFVLNVPFDAIDTQNGAIEVTAKLPALSIAENATRELLAERIRLLMPGQRDKSASAHENAKGAAEDASFKDCTVLVSAWLKHSKVRWEGDQELLAVTSGINADSETSRVLIDLESVSDNQILKDAFEIIKGELRQPQLKTTLVDAYPGLDTSLLKIEFVEPFSGTVRISANSDIGQSSDEETTPVTGRVFIGTLDGVSNDSRYLISLNDSNPLVATALFGQTAEKWLANKGLAVATNGKVETAVASAMIWNGQIWCRWRGNSIKHKANFDTGWLHAAGSNPDAPAPNGASSANFASGFKPKTYFRFIDGVPTWQVFAQTVDNTAIEVGDFKAMKDGQFKFESASNALALLDLIDEDARPLISIKDGETTHLFTPFQLPQLTLASDVTKTIPIRWDGARLKVDRGLIQSLVQPETPPAPNLYDVGLPDGILPDAATIISSALRPISGTALKRFAFSGQSTLEMKLHSADEKPTRVRCDVNRVEYLNNDENKTPAALTSENIDLESLDLEIEQKFNVTIGPLEIKVHSLRFQEGRWTANSSLTGFGRALVRRDVHVDKLDNLCSDVLQSLLRSGAQFNLGPDSVWYRLSAEQLDPWERLSDLHEKSMKEVAGDSGTSGTSLFSLSDLPNLAIEIGQGDLNSSPLLSGTMRFDSSETILDFSSINLPGEFAPIQMALLNSEWKLDGPKLVPSDDFGDVLSLGDDHLKPLAADLLTELCHSFSTPNMGAQYLSSVQPKAIKKRVEKGAPILKFVSISPLDFQIDVPIEVSAEAVKTVLGSKPDSAVAMTLRIDKRGPRLVDTTSLRKLVGDKLLDFGETLFELVISELETYADASGNIYKTDIDRELNGTLLGHGLFQVRLVNVNAFAPDSDSLKAVIKATSSTDQGTAIPRWKVMESAAIEFDLEILVGGELHRITGRSRVESDTNSTSAHKAFRFGEENRLELSSNSSFELAADAKQKLLFSFGETPLLKVSVIPTDDLAKEGWIPVENEINLTATAAIDTEQLKRRLDQGRKEDNEDNAPTMNITPEGCSAKSNVSIGWHSGIEFDPLVFEESPKKIDATFRSPIRVGLVSLGKLSIEKEPSGWFGSGSGNIELNGKSAPARIEGVRLVDGQLSFATATVRSDKLLDLVKSLLGKLDGPFEIELVSFGLQRAEFRVSISESFPKLEIPKKDWLVTVRTVGNEIRFEVDGRIIGDVKKIEELLSSVAKQWLGDWLRKNAPFRLGWLEFSNPTVLDTEEFEIDFDVRAFVPNNNRFKSQIGIRFRSEKWEINSVQLLKDAKAKAESILFGKLPPGVRFSASTGEGNFEITADLSQLSVSLIPETGKLEPNTDFKLKVSYTADDENQASATGYVSLKKDWTPELSGDFEKYFRNWAIPTITPINFQVELDEHKLLFSLRQKDDDKTQFRLYTNLHISKPLSKIGEEEFEGAIEDAIQAEKVNNDPELLFIDNIVPRVELNIKSLTNQEVNLEKLRRIVSAIDWAGVDVKAGNALQQLVQPLKEKLELLGIQDIQYLKFQKRISVEGTLHELIPGSDNQPYKVEIPLESGLDGMVIGLADGVIQQALTGLAFEDGGFGAEVTSAGVHGASLDQAEFFISADFIVEFDGTELPPFPITATTPVNNLVKFKFEFGSIEDYLEQQLKGKFASFGPLEITPADAIKKKRPFTATLKLAEKFKLIGYGGQFNNGRLKVPDRFQLDVDGELYYPPLVIYGFGAGFDLSEPNRIKATGNASLTAGQENFGKVARIDGELGLEITTDNTSIRSITVSDQADLVLLSVFDQMSTVGNLTVDIDALEFSGNQQITTKEPLSSVVSIDGAIFLKGSGSGLQSNGQVDATLFKLIKRNVNYDLYANKSGSFGFTFNTSQAIPIVGSVAIGAGIKKSQDELGALLDAAGELIGANVDIHLSTLGGDSSYVSARYKGQDVGRLNVNPLDAEASLNDVEPELRRMIEALKNLNTDPTPKDGPRGKKKKRRKGPKGEGGKDSPQTSLPVESPKSFPPPDEPAWPRKPSDTGGELRYWARLVNDGKNQALLQTWDSQGGKNWISQGVIGTWCQFVLISGEKAPLSFVVDADYLLDESKRPYLNVSLQNDIVVLEFDFLVPNDSGLIGIYKTSLSINSHSNNSINLSRPECNCGGTSDPVVDPKIVVTEWEFTEKSIIQIKPSGKVPIDNTDNLRKYPVSSWDNPLLSSKIPYRGGLSFVKFADEKNEQNPIFKQASVANTHRGWMWKYEKKMLQVYSVPMPKNAAGTDEDLNTVYLRIFLQEKNTIWHLTAGGFSKTEALIGDDLTVGEHANYQIGKVEMSPEQPYMMFFKQKKYQRSSPIHLDKKQN